MAEAQQNTPPEEEVTSPLVKLVRALTGGSKKPAAGKPAADEAAPKVVKGKPAGKPVAKKAKAAAPAAGGPPPKVNMPPGPLVTVITRNEFYRDGFRNLIKIAILEAVIIAGLVGALAAYITGSTSYDRYFATTADGRIMQLTPLDKQNMSPAALMSWVAQAATETMTFGFHDYQRRLQQSSRHFTKTGWESYTAALQKAGIIDSMVAQEQVATAQPRSAPVLIQQGVLGGKYRWVIRLPLQVIYRSGSTSRSDNLKVQMVVERVPSLENPNGVGIAQWVAVSQ